MLTGKRLIELGFVIQFYKDAHLYYQKGRLILVPYLAGWLCGVELGALMVTQASYIETEEQLLKLLNNR